jgi:CBS domain-containing protein
MTGEPVTVSAELPLEAASLLMIEHGIHHLPVVEGDRPVGMIGMRDAMRPGLRTRSGIGLGF